MGGVAWTEEEDHLLRKCVQQYGEGKWHRVPLLTGLKRCRKSCRLRWLNYLRPNIKRGSFTDAEVEMIIKLHKLLGNRWSLIAGRLPGRTANDVKNYWNCHLSKKLNAQEEAAERELMKPQPSRSIIASTSTRAEKQRSQEETCPTPEAAAAAAAAQEQEGIMGFEFEQVQEDWDDLFLDLDLHINDFS